VVTCAVTLLLLLAPGARGQTITLHGGAATSGLTAPPEVERRQSVMFGAAVSLRVWKALWVRVGATHVGKGGGWDVREGRAEILADYIEFSALLKLNLNLPGRVPVHLLLGPSFGFQRKCRLSVVVTHPWGQRESIVTVCEELPDAPVRRDGAAVGGIGITWNAPRPLAVRSLAKHIPVSLEVLYASGISSIFMNRDVGGKTRTLSVVLRAGITLWR